MLTYSKSCIHNELCNAELRTSALYDYVGAVYGEEGRVEYDGQLTDAEKNYVLKTFGKLEGKGDLIPDQNAYAYVTKARESFFNRNTAKFQTPDQMLQQACIRYPHQKLSFKTYKGGAAFLIGGYHGCGEFFAQDYLKMGIEFLVAANPEPWVMMIEGYGNVEPSSREALLFEKIAKVLRLPIYNPVLSPSNPEIIDRAVKKYGGNKYDYIISTTDFFHRFIELALQNLNQFDQILDHCIDFAVQKYKVDGNELRSHFFKLFEYPETQKSALWQRLSQDDAFGRKIVKKVDQYVKRMGELSNEVSSLHVHHSFDATERKSVVGQVGEFHLSMLEGALKAEKKTK